ncbi:MAG: tyrosine-type recombinase/integrase [Pirellulaceae bacterium]|nr:tyrosine-type recombinase/integrase [Pirellulaceae bacterium]
MGRKKSSRLVKVTQHGSRPFAMYYDNPITGKREWRSTESQNRNDALAKAGEWEADIKANRYRPDSNITWADFRELFLEDRLQDAKPKTRAAYICAFNSLERHVKIGRLAELTAERIKHAAGKWREEKLAAETIRSYLRHVRSALNWAHEHEFLRGKVKVATEKRKHGTRRMKGRPITGEEFDRMLAKVAAGLVQANATERTTEATLARLHVKAEPAATAWRRFLQALYLGGLRLGEAASLSWDDERFITVDFSGQRPRLRIEAGQDKSGEERLLPLAPEFAEILAEVPADQRSGRVFRLPGLTGGIVDGLEYVSAVISAIGKAAGVKVRADSGPGGKVKFASAHDLRRAFGARWATRVMPAVLQKMMRHADISTTMKYYADLDAKSVEGVIYGLENKTGGFVDGASSIKPANQS